LYKNPSGSKIKFWKAKKLAKTSAKSAKKRLFIIILYKSNNSDWVFTEKI